jgi:hypothetical protein
MGSRAAVRPNHGAAASHRHAEAASYRGRARGRWFACLGGVGHFIELERGGRAPWALGGRQLMEKHNNQMEVGVDVGRGGG